MPTLKQMFEKGVHFGHLKERTDARFQPYLFALKDKVYLINLEKTQECLKKAVDFLTKEAKKDSLFLWIGTKYQAKEIVSKIAQDLGQPYVTERWLGGILTNFETVLGSIKTMLKLKEKVETEEFKALPTKQKLIELKKLRRLEANFRGLEKLTRLPDVLIMVDAKNESIAIKEANEREIPVVAVTDVDSNPQLITYPIPANDDSVTSLSLILNVLKETIGKGKAKKEEKGKAEKKKEKVTRNKKQ